MRPTDEERIEVARRLRKNAEEHPKMQLILNVVFACDSLRPEGAMEWNVTSRDAAMYLADLIEPEQTCRWVSVEERLPDCAGEYIVAYHPCYHAFVNENKTLVGMDLFMGKTAWTERKYQRVTHWMPKPELPKAVE